MKKILAFLLIALLISGCESNSGNKSIDEGDVFVVGMECNYPPFNWQTNTQSDTAVSIGLKEGSRNSTLFKKVQKCIDNISSEKRNEMMGKYSSSQPKGE